MKLDRLKAAVSAQETNLILRVGSYRDSAGNAHAIGEDIKNSRQGTKEYRPDWQLPDLEEFGAQYDTKITVQNVPTLLAAKELHDEGLNVASLNFASARNPGGGFLSGARAQEEYLCRNSSLYACLKGQSFYDFHIEEGGAFYSSYTLYSPQVSVIRSEDNALAAPWKTAVLTAAAPNINRETVPLPRLQAAFVERIRKVLAIALENKHDALVLGAWGCGAFGNPPQLVAQVWREQLEGDFKNRFAKISFAVLDYAPETPNYRVFEKEFAP